MARFPMRGSLAGLMKRITIAGGGLAGLSLAIALRKRGVPVSVTEAGSYPRHRVCGEFISGVSIETLENLGIKELFGDALQHRSLKWYDGEKVIHQNTLPTPAIGISRYVLDDRLQQHLTELGGSLSTRTRAQPIPEEGLVWAAGRRPQSGQWIGLKAHVGGIEMSADLEMHSGHNGYAGLAGIEDGWINVCGLFRIDRQLKGQPQELLPTYLRAGGNHALAEQLGQAEWRPDSGCAVAGFKLGSQPPLHGLVSIGDAESMIPPFTGNGMSMAFQAAEIAIEPLVAWSSNQSAWQETTNHIQSALRKRFRKRLISAQAIHPILFQRHGRDLIHAFSETQLLPFRPMLAMVR